MSEVVKLGGESESSNCKLSCQCQRGRGPGTWNPVHACILSGGRGRIQLAGQAWPGVSWGRGEGGQIQHGLQAPAHRTQAARLVTQPAVPMRLDSASDSGSCVPVTGHGHRPRPRAEPWRSPSQGSRSRSEWLEPGCRLHAGSLALTHCSPGHACVIGVHSRVCSRCGHSLNWH